MTASGVPATAPWVFDHVVIGCSDIAASIAFFAFFGFDPVATGALDAAAATRYGAVAGADEVVLAVPGSTGGRLRLISVDRPAEPYSPYSPRVEALDLYAADMPAALTQVAAAGWPLSGPPADYPFGPMRLQQASVVGPDDVMLVLVDINHRLPSLLDSSDAPFSELHSVVCVVDDLDAATEYFTAVAGLQLRATFPLTEPAVPAFMGLPRPSSMRMSVLSSAEAAPPRFELLQFDDEPAEPRPSLPLSAGALLPVFVVAGMGEPEVRQTPVGVPVELCGEPLR
jgi:catechol 2,3-dioxygenase-like lactoylglutathione lyase family enzyme